MRHFLICPLRAFWLSITLGLSTIAFAATPGDTPHRQERQRTVLSGAPQMEVVSSIVNIPPGQSAEMHFHHGVEAAYVIQGAEIQVPDKAPMLLPTGRSVMNLRDVRHGGFVVLGETPLRLFTVHIVDKNKPLYDIPPSH